MIKVNVEIRLENTLSGYSQVTPIKKETLLSDKLIAAQEAVSKQLPELATKSFMVTPGKSWNKLPKTLYKAVDPNQEGSVIIKKTTKKMVVLCSEYATFTLHTEYESPTVEVTLLNNDLI